MADNQVSLGEHFRRIAIMLYAHGKYGKYSGIRCGIRYPYVEEEESVEGCNMFLDLPVEIWHDSDIGILRYLDEYTIMSITMAGPRMLQLILPMMKAKGSFNGRPLYQPEFVTSYTAPLICEKGLIIPQLIEEKNHDVLRVWLCVEDMKIIINRGNIVVIDSMILERTTNKVWAKPRAGIAKLCKKTRLAILVVVHGKEFTHYTSLMKDGKELIPSRMHSSRMSGGIEEPHVCIYKHVGEETYSIGITTIYDLDYTPTDHIPSNNGLRIKDINIFIKRRQIQRKTWQ